MTDAATIVAEARAAQPTWEATPLSQRIDAIRGLRRAIAADPVAWADAIDPPQQRSRSESLAAEVGPLADACRWLEKNAAGTLRPRGEGRGWGTVSLRVERKPLGVVLVIGASNYPLFLLAAPAIHALVAGNAVLLKPPPGGEAVAALLHENLTESRERLPPCYLLSGSAESAQAAIDSHVDHVVLTGSADTGRAVAQRAAGSLTGCTLECSGSDVAVILPNAGIDRAVACIAWGRRLTLGRLASPHDGLSVGRSRSPSWERGWRSVSPTPSLVVFPSDRRTGSAGSLAKRSTKGSRCFRRGGSTTRGWKRLVTRGVCRRSCCEPTAPALPCSTRTCSPRS